MIFFVQKNQILVEFWADAYHKMPHQIVSPNLSKKKVQHWWVPVRYGSLGECQNFKQNDREQKGSFHPGFCLFSFCSSPNIFLTLFHSCICLSLLFYTEHFKCFYLHFNTFLFIFLNLRHSCFLWLLPFVSFFKVDDIANLLQQTGEAGAVLHTPL